jgi:hypothetical protein
MGARIKGEKPKREMPENKLLRSMEVHSMMMDCAVVDLDLPSSSHIMSPFVAS